MDDKTLALLHQVLDAAGTAGIKGFAFTVRYVLIGGVTDMATAVALCVLTIFAFYRIKAWQPKPTKYLDDNPGAIVRGIVIGALLLSNIIWICLLFSGVQVLLAPEGAAIHSLLSR